MGEIATWSAVKTKVGLGKTGNDCPTKAELLALSPTGTGDNYVALELSNASSYGNNECVQLADIHKVTYKYTYTIQNSTLTFPASGGASSPTIFGTSSTKQKYLDGIAQGSPIAVGEDFTLPNWVKINNGTYIATENLDLSQRSNTITLTQAESGKTVQGTFVQAAATQTWDYTFSVSPTSLTFAVTGETKTLSVSSSKQEYRNGHTYGSAVALSYSRTNTGSISGEGTSVTMGNNTSTSARSGTVTLVQSETDKSLTISCSQAAGYHTYSEITITSNPTCNDIPAAGGSISTFSTLPEYSQTWGWNGSTTGGGTITSGASLSYGSPVGASSLEGTVKDRSSVGTLTGTLSLNGKTKSVSATVYQQANRRLTIEELREGIYLKLTEISGSTVIPSAGKDISMTFKVVTPFRIIYTSGYSSREEREALPIVGSLTFNSIHISGITVLPYTITPVSLGGSYISEVRISFGENTTSSRRSVIIKFDYYEKGSSITHINFRFDQLIKTEDVEGYVFSGMRDSLIAGNIFSFGYNANLQQQRIKIYSYKMSKNSADGSVIRDYLPVSLTPYSSNWISAGVSNNSGSDNGAPYAELLLYIAQNNNNSQREITLQLTQPDSNKVVDVRITQSSN